MEKAVKELEKIGYTFEYGLDGQAYDLRKIGQKGKSEEYAKGGYMEKGGITGDVHSLTDKLLSQKIQIFIDKVKPIKYYYIDEKSNSLVVGLDENYTQDAADKFHKEAISSMEFFDADSVDMEYMPKTKDTQYSIKLKKPVKFAKGGYMEKGGKTASEDVVYIQFRNSKKGFSIDKKYFRGVDAYKEAVKWGRKNIDNFNMDMLKFEMAKGGYMEEGSVTDFGDFYEWSGKEVKKKFGSNFDGGFPIVKFVKYSKNKEVENASGVLENGKTVVFNVNTVEWEFDDKMAKGGMMAKGDMSENLDLYIDYNRSKPYEYQKVTNMLTLNALQKNGLIEFTYDMGKDTRRYATEGDKMHRGAFGMPKYIRPRSIKSAVKPLFSYKNKDYFIGYEKGINFFEFYVLKKGTEWNRFNKEKMASGGKVKFADKVKSIKKSLLERKKVSPKVQKDYGKTYSPKEAEESANRIVGAMMKKREMK